MTDTNKFHIGVIIGKCKNCGCQVQIANGMTVNTHKQGKIINFQEYVKEVYNGRYKNI